MGIFGEAPVELPKMAMQGGMKRLCCVHARSDFAGHCCQCWAELLPPPFGLLFGLRWNLPVDRWWNIMESQTIPDIFIWAPPGRIQGLSLMKGYFVLSSLVGKLPIIAYSLGSGAHSFTCGLSVFPAGEASYPCCESVIDALGLGAPSSPFRKQEGWRDSAQVFFHSPCFLTLITFCCGKEMRWGLKTDHCPPPRLMQRKRYCLLNG